MGMTDCWCDYEAPEFTSTRTPVARQEHECSECSYKIQPGEKYERVTGLWDGHLDTFKTCFACVAVREALEEMPCFCWSHGGLWEDIAIQFTDADFPPGWRFRFLRLVVAHRLRRKT